MHTHTCALARRLTNKKDVATPGLNPSYMPVPSVFPGGKLSVSREIPQRTKSFKWKCICSHKIWDVCILNSYYIYVHSVSLEMNKYCRDFFLCVKIAITGDIMSHASAVVHTYLLIYIHIYLIHKCSFISFLPSSAHLRLIILWFSILSLSIKYIFQYYT